MIERPENPEEGDIFVIASTPVPTEVRENQFCPNGNPETCGNPEGYMGVKFNYSLEAGESQEFTFTLNTTLPVGETCALVKFGNEALCGTICAPVCPS